MVFNGGSCPQTRAATVYLDLIHRVRPSGVGKGIAARELKTNMDTIGIKVGRPSLDLPDSNGLRARGSGGSGWSRCRGRGRCRRCGRGCRSRGGGCRGGEDSFGAPARRAVGAAGPDAYEYLFVCLGGVEVEVGQGDRSAVAYRGHPTLAVDDPVRDVVCHDVGSAGRGGRRPGVGQLVGHPRAGGLTGRRGRCNGGRGGGFLQGQDGCGQEAGHDVSADSIVGAEVASSPTWAGNRDSHSLHPLDVAMGPVSFIGSSPGVVCVDVAERLGGC